MKSRNPISFLICIAAASVVPTVAFGQFPQGFEAPAAGLPAGWTSVNASPGGPGANPDWQIRTDNGGATFPQHSGIGYAFANFNASTGTNPISLYLMSPVVTLENGAVIKFWTRAPAGSTFPDRMILTYSLNGASSAVTDFGNHPTNVDFHKLLDINPTLAQGVYPGAWTQFTVTISGIAVPTQGRFAFWYYVQTSAGPQGTNSDYIGVDDVEFIPPGVTTGACCDGAGGCSLTTPANCTGLGNTYYGIASECGAITCTGKCCIPFGTCENRPPNDCVGAGYVFGGVGSACDPQNTEECLGRCCGADGSCTPNGPEPCTQAGGVFGGVGSTCDGNQCKGRCCLPNGTCDSAANSPNACAIAGGTFTLGQDCSAYTDFVFTTGGATGSTGPLPMPIPDPVVAVTEVSNVQTVSGFVGNISDLNVSVQVNHTYTGDIEAKLEFNGMTVNLIAQLGLPLGGFGCSTANFNVKLDDEATDGSVNNQCNATPPAASSPPSYVPTELLSAFDGISPNGNWTLKVTDWATPDTGSLISWTLHVGKTAGANVVCAPACACKGDMNGSGAVNGADINKFAQCVVAPAGAGCACADVNGGGITTGDIAPFVNFLLTGVGSCVP